MLVVEITGDAFEQVQECLQELFPDVTVELISKEISLPNGLEIPCAFSLNVSWQKLEDMMQTLMQYEIDAFNTDARELPAADDPYFLQYKRYGWLWDLFYNAKSGDRIKEV